MVSIHLVPASLEQVSAVCGYQAKYLNNLKDTVWQHGTMVSILASEPCCPRFNYQHSKKNYDVKIVDVAEVDQEESGQWLDGVDQSHLVLARGKQKNLKDIQIWQALIWVVTVS